MKTTACGCLSLLLSTSFSHSQSFGGFDKVIDQSTESILPLEFSIVSEKPGETPSQILVHPRFSNCLHPLSSLSPRPNASPRF